MVIRSWGGGGGGVEDPRSHFVLILNSVLVNAAAARPGYAGTMDTVRLFPRWNFTMREKVKRGVGKVNALVEVFQWSWVWFCLAALRAWSHRCIGCGFVSCSTCRLRGVWRCAFRRLHSPGPSWQTCRWDLDGLIKLTGLYPTNSPRAFSKWGGRMGSSACPEKFSARTHWGTLRLFISVQVPQHLGTSLWHSSTCLSMAETVLLNTREGKLRVSQTSS